MQTKDGSFWTWFFAWFIMENLVNTRKIEFRVLCLLEWHSLMVKKVQSKVQEYKLDKNGVKVLREKCKK